MVATSMEKQTQGAGRDQATVTWMGCSGRAYAFVREPLDSFILTEGCLYLLAEGGNVLWVGAARDLVEEQSSRTRFRHAIERGAAVYRMRAPDDDLGRMTAIWDLETKRDAA
jgi:hypothetical protein